MTGGQSLSLLQHRTLAFRKRREGLVARNRADQLVEIPRSLGFRGLLDLEQIGRMDGAAVGLDLALAKQRVIGWDRFHLLHDLDAIMRVAAERVQGLDAPYRPATHPGL